MYTYIHITTTRASGGQKKSWPCLKMFWFEDGTPRRHHSCLSMAQRPMCYSFFFFNSISFFVCSSFVFFLCLFCYLPFGLHTEEFHFIEPHTTTPRCLFYSFFFSYSLFTKIYVFRRNVSEGSARRPQKLIKHLGVRGGMESWMWMLVCSTLIARIGLNPQWTFWSSGPINWINDGNWSR